MLFSLLSEFLSSSPTSFNTYHPPTSNLQPATFACCCLHTEKTKISITHISPHKKQHLAIMAQPPDFPLFWTDGDQTHTPSQEEISKGYRTSDEYSLTKKALSNFATEMLRKLGRKTDRGESDKHRSFFTAPPITMSSCYICFNPYMTGHLTSSSLSFECVNLDLLCWSW